MRSLFISILVKILVVVFIPIFLGTYVIYCNYRNHLHKDIQSMLLTKVEQNTKLIDIELNAVRNKIKEYVKLLSLNNQNKEKLFKTLFFSDKNLNELILLDNESKVVIGLSKIRIINKGRHINTSSLKKCSIVKKDNDVLFKYFLRKNDFSIIAYISLRHLFNNFSINNEKTQTFILDSSGDIIFHSNFNYILANRDYSGLKNFMNEK
jgi:hypothetical protein